MNKQIFNEIQTLKRQILPNEKVILFGSQARGDAHENSDWDLLILLNKDKRNFIEDSNTYAYPFAEIGFKYGKTIMAMIYTTSEWKNRKPSLLYKNIERDGIEIN